MKFIELTLDDDTKILVNSEHISHVTDCGNEGCEVTTLDGDYYNVKESFNTIKLLIS